MSRKLRVLALVTASAALGLVAAELWFRFVHRVPFRAPAETVADWAPDVWMHRPSQVPGLAYEIKPSIERDVLGFHVRTSHLGLRGHEVEDAKPAGTLRICALGDSVTFGLNVADEESWPSQLERELEAHPVLDGRRCEVLNFGVVAYSSTDEAAVLEHRLAALAPDLVLVGYYLNDPETVPLQRLQRQFTAAQWWEHSALARFLAWKVREAAVASHGGDTLRYLHDPEGPCWPSVPAAFARMARAARELNVKVLVVTLPTFFGVRRAPSGAHETDSAAVPAGATEWAEWAQYPYAREHAQVVQAAEQCGLAAFDPMPCIAQSGLKPCSLMSDFDHPNVRGNALIARCVRLELQRRVSELFAQR